MKKNQLASALAAAVVGIAGIANLSNAVNVNPDGTGQVLIYPYYTVEAGNDTLVSVVNTANEVKAVKVRIHEQVNSREVLDFHLYLSPFDVWTAAITTNPNGDAANGFPILFTADRSCTVPDIVTNQLLPIISTANPTRYIEFSNLLLQGRPATHARAGYLEMIEMGVVGNIAGFTPAAWATHGANGIPAACGLLNTAWQNGGVWAGLNGVPLANFPLLNQTAISAPTGGLFGGGSIINVSQGRLMSYNATAIEGVEFTGSGNQHQEPGFITPNLASYMTGSASQVANVFVGGRLVQSTYNAGGRIDALSATMAFTNIANEYVFTAGADETFRSEWVVTFPTKRHYTDALVSVAVPPVAPFQRRSDPNGGCEEFSMVAYNREEGRAPFIFFNGLGFSPSLIQALCAEANVVNWENVPPGSVGTSGFAPLASSPILGARFNTGALLRVGLPQGFNAGWANLSFQSQATQRAFRPSVDGDVWFGLPTVGFWVLAAQNNAAAPGIRAFYSGTYSHRGQRRCENAAGC